MERRPKKRNLKARVRRPPIVAAGFTIAKDGSIAEEWAQRRGDDAPRDFPDWEIDARALALKLAAEAPEGLGGAKEVVERAEAYFRFLTGGRV